MRKYLKRVHMSLQFFEYYEALAALLSFWVHLAPIFESILIGGTSNNALTSAKSHMRSRNSICMK